MGYWSSGRRDEHFRGSPYTIIWSGNLSELFENGLRRACLIVVRAKVRSRGEGKEARTGTVSRKCYADGPVPFGMIHIRITAESPDHRRLV